MKRYFKWILVFIVLILAFKMTFTQPIHKRISNALGITIPRSINIYYEDTHGGFHGDGDLVAKMQFNKKESENLLLQIKNNSNWMPLPLTPNIERALYQYYGLTEKINMPHIDKGYWFLVDRFGGEIRGNDDNKLFYRSAANFTVGVYDAVNHTLYYYELDT